MRQHARKLLNEFWLDPEDILKMEDVWLNIENWMMCNSTHEYANKGFHMKITSNGRAVSSHERLNHMDSQRNDTYSTEHGPILSERIQLPNRHTGSTKIRIYSPIHSSKKFTLSFVMPGFHYCPETVFTDLMSYHYYSSTSVNLKLRNPTLKSAEQILNEIPFELLLEAHNKKMYQSLGDYRPKIPKRRPSAEIIDLRKSMGIKHVRVIKRSSIKDIING